MQCLKGFARKLLCGVLAAALLWAVPGVALAAEEETPAVEILEPAPLEQAGPLVAKGGLILAPAEDVSKYPIIRFGGAMGQFFRNWGTDEEEVMFDKEAFLTFGNILPLVVKCVFAFVALDYDRVAKLISDFLWEGFGAIRMDENGQSVLPDLTMNGWSQIWHLYENNMTHFFSDWRLSPWDSAEELYDYIENYIKTNEHGHKKVNLIGMSGNGNSVLAYLDRYGTKQLASVYFNISLHEGTSTHGNIAIQQMALDAAALGNLSLLKMNERFIKPDPVEWIIRGLYETGLFGFFSKIFKFNYDRVMQKIYDDALIPLFFTMPHIWSYVPLGQYDEAKRLLLKGDPKYEKLEEKIDSYHRIMENADNILRKAASEIKAAVHAGYNSPLLGYTAGANVHSDGKVDTQYASFGATCAPLRQTFSSSYRQAVPSEYNYVSPDRMVDASTCAIPELTWFGKDQPHSGSAEYNGWYQWFLSTEEDYTVHGNPDFPQFLQYVGNDTYIPLTAKPRPAVVEYLNLMVLWLMKAWRSMLLLPLFWI